MKNDSHDADLANPPHIPALGCGTTFSTAAQLHPQTHGLQCKADAGNKCSRVHTDRKFIWIVDFRCLLNPEKNLEDQ
jgi:hypothetical protein